MGLNNLWNIHGQWFGKWGELKRLSNRFTNKLMLLLSLVWAWIFPWNPEKAEATEANTASVVYSGNSLSFSPFKNVTLWGEVYNKEFIWTLKTTIANLENEGVSIEVSLGKELQQYLATGQINVSEWGKVKLTIWLLNKIEELYGKRVNLTQGVVWAEYNQSINSFADVVLRWILFNSKWENCWKVDDILDNNWQVSGWKEVAFTGARRYETMGWVSLKVVDNVRIALEWWYYSQTNKRALWIHWDTSTWIQWRLGLSYWPVSGSAHFKKWQKPWYQASANVLGGVSVFWNYNIPWQKGFWWGLKFSLPLDKGNSSQQGRWWNNNYAINPVQWTQTRQVYGKIVTRDHLNPKEDAPTEKGAPTISEITPTSVQWENGIKDKDGIRNIRFFLIVGTNTTPLESDTWLFENISPDTPCSMYTIAETYNILTREWNEVESEKTSFRTSEVPNQAPTQPTLTGNTTITIGESMDLQFSSTDADWNDLTYRVIGTIPAWTTFDANTGKLTGTPTTVEIGSFEVVANDGTEDSEKLTVNYEVKEAAVPLTAESFTQDFEFQSSDTIDMANHTTWADTIRIISTKSEYGPNTINTEVNGLNLTLSVNAIFVEDWEVKYVPVKNWVEWPEATITVINLYEQP